MVLQSKDEVLEKREQKGHQKETVGIPKVHNKNRGLGEMDTHRAD